MRRLGLLLGLSAALILIAGGLTTAGARVSTESKACTAGSVRGVIASKKVCLKAGQKCLRRYDTQYHRFGFHCHASGRLTRRRRPPRTQHAPRLTVLKRSSADSPGYIFIAPKGTAAAGPEILDDRGRPVWFHPSGQATDFRVQSYRGKPVLTWWQGAAFGEGGAGTSYIADSSYRVIGTVRAGNGLEADGHEFALTPQGTALVTIYHEVPYDLSPVGGPKDGRVGDGVVQEIDVETGRVLFEWHSLDHVPLDESYAPVESPYDYIHINAVNLDDDGNLVISGRHTWTVYKVDRQSGRVIWRLGGKKSDFTLGADAQFAWQHNPLPAGENTIRLFDNESDGLHRIGPQSRVIWLNLDTAAATATLAKAIAQPQGLSAESQGNAQALVNGDTFVGWGALGRVSEFDPQGRLLFNAVLAGGDTYRAYRAQWVGQPDTRPTATAWTNADGTTTVHAIWNGATQVAAWRILAGPTARRLTRARTAPWNGLDTVVRIRGIPLEAQVVAIDAAGRVIGTSAPARAG
jgi:Arylsulfotransferase (ASST)